MHHISLQLVGISRSRCELVVVLIETRRMMCVSGLGEVGVRRGDSDCVREKVLWLRDSHMPAQATCGRGPMSRCKIFSLAIELAFDLIK